MTAPELVGKMFSEGLLRPLATADDARAAGPKVCRELAVQIRKVGFAQTEHLNSPPKLSSQTFRLLLV